MLEEVRDAASRAVPLAGAGRRILMVTHRDVVRTGSTLPTPVGEGSHRVTADRVIHITSRPSADDDPYDIAYVYVGHSRAFDAGGCVLTLAKMTKVVVLVCPCSRNSSRMTDLEVMKRRGLLAEYVIVPDCGGIWTLGFIFDQLAQ